MPLFKKAAIIGVGLIGGSLALGIKKNKLAREVVGVSRHKKTISLAVKMKAIDKGSVSLDIIKGSDLVIICTPVDLIVKLSSKIAKFLDSDCIVTDVGSTKQNIYNSLKKVFPNYIGSHPLAGSEKRGVINASLDIFRGSLCILTLDKENVSCSFDKIRKMWHKLGVRTVTMTPAMHDEFLGFASHLPHIAAYALINSIPKKTLMFSAGGLKDTTRIASSDPSIWRDIFLTNRENLIKAIGAFENSLEKIKSAIKANDAKSLRKILSRSQKIRESLK